MKYGVIVGSLRKNSYSLGVAETLTSNLPSDIEVESFDISALPLYNQDFDDETPEIYQTFRQWVATKDAFIIVTPEHNRSIPAALKNAIDIASRPWGENLWQGKFFLVASASISSLGGIMASTTLRHSLDFLDTKIMDQPELYIGNVASLADEKGKIIDPDTKQFLVEASQKFTEFVKE